MSTVSVRERSSEVKVKFVDFGDFPETGQESVTGFFKEIGNLNATFAKRFSQFVSLHPSTPLGEMMEEYIRYQQELEDKYGVRLHARVVRTVREESVSKSVPTGSHASTPPATADNFARLDFPRLTSNRDTASPRSTASEEVRDSPKKRKADILEEPSKIPQFVTAARKEVPPPNEKAVEKRSEATESALGRNGQSSSSSIPSGFFNLNTTKATEVTAPAAKPAEDATKKSVFAGFGSLPAAASTSASASVQNSFANSSSLNFNSFFGSSSGNSSFGNASLDTSKAAGTFPSFTSDPKPDSSAAKPAASPSSFPASTSFFSSFNSSAVAPVSLGGFSFAGMGAPKLPTVKPADADDNEDGDDGGEADVIPIVPPEEQDVAEADAIVSRKCVVYYMDNGAFTKRGVGMAHVKLLEGSNEAVQLLIRASTSLGAILLNTRISKGMKPTRNSQPGAGGKSQESVGFISPATPPFKGADPAKPYSWTLKFKDAKEADDFYKGIEDNIKK
ncbi:hypothetical protein BV898_13964 [Hypsibius exemplaris]|uniref:RanBD1 domain-containing protein n=1 Tax=Hypsibius exemplaris TaxID=2072580 RepID=A0A1W0W991_HYPEX|nr:hypothetical protein BV898_13964 [Hypsibius exemplaris]